MIKPNFKIKNVYLERERGRDVNAQVLTVEYIEETDISITKHIIKSPLYFSNSPTISVSEYYRHGHHVDNKVNVDYGFGEIEGGSITSEVIAYKEKEMTIEEIEKALGHKVKIVSGCDIND